MLSTFFILASIVNGCILISAFACLCGIPAEIMSSAIVSKICAITAGIKKYKSIIKKKKHDKIVLWAKFKLNRIVIISKALTDSYTSYDEFVLVNNMLKEYDNMKEKMKHLKTQAVHGKV